LYVMWPERATGVGRRSVGRDQGDVGLYWPKKDLAQGKLKLGANMTRGPKKHLKRLNAPRHWMLDKLTGNFAPKPSAGPHKQRECLPMLLLLRNRLKYALTYREVKLIVLQRLIKVDHQVRSDHLYPVGFQDVVSIEKTAEHFRLLFDTKGRYIVHPVTAAEAQFKLCKVKTKKVGDKGIPLVTTHDGRTFRYPDPLICAGDVVKVDITSTPAKIIDFTKLEVGNVCMINGGRNTGRVGVIQSIEKHPGSFNIIHIKDAADHAFATRAGNVFPIGKGAKSWVELPKNKGVKKSKLEEMKAN